VRALDAAAGAAGDGADAHVPRTLEQVEREHVERTLRAHRSNRTHAARELGISRATLIKKIKDYGLRS
jgi:DNA-binding NtrC family response regulator